MPGEELIVGTAIAAGAYVGQKLFGTALATMGDDINKVYVKGRDKIVAMAAKKVPNPDDGKMVNLRAARDVLWNGAITDDEVCAEYFGGMLAASRSEDGKDDAVVNYVDTIKAMSSKQLELHYVIYAAWQSLLLTEKKKINVGQSSEVNKERLVLPTVVLQARSIVVDRELTVLHRLSLIQQYRYDNHHFESGITVPYTEVTPTTFGVMLFAVAHNKLDSWRQFTSMQFESAAGIQLVTPVARTIAALCEAAGIAPSADKKP